MVRPEERVDGLVKDGELKPQRTQRAEDGGFFVGQKTEQKPHLLREARLLESGHRYAQVQMAHMRSKTRQHRLVHGGRHATLGGESVV